VSKSISQAEISKPKEFLFGRFGFLVSCFLVLHLFGIGLSYATNWRRSEIQDKVLVWLYPYLIGGSWYQESLPVEWISDMTKSRSISVSLQQTNELGKWKEMLDSESPITRLDEARKDRLRFLLAELALSEDAEGLTRIFKSMVLHHEATVKEEKVSKIRLTSSQVTGEGAQDDGEMVLFEASIARFESGDLGFILKTEDHRSVRSTWNEKKP